MNDLKNRKIVLKFLESMYKFMDTEVNRKFIKSQYKISHTQLKNLVENRTKAYSKTQLKNLSILLGNVAKKLLEIVSLDLDVVKKHSISKENFLRICEILDVDIIYELKKEF